MPVTFLTGDVRARLAELPDASVHCVVTSPPYWGLRDYGAEPQVWGGDRECEHEWEPARYYVEGGGGAGSSGKAFSKPGEANAERIKKARWREDATCAKCGAWRGQLGLEPTIKLYVEHIVEVFREVRRVLRKDGTLWLNMGDCYGHTGACGGASPLGPNQGRMTDRIAQERTGGTLGGSVKPKDMVGQPWRVAFALQADGWWLRSDIVWAKPNPMPESCRDRPTKAHEYVFLMTKAPKYFFDQEAVREGVTGDAHARRRDGERSPRYMDDMEGHNRRGGTWVEDGVARTSRNIRSVWTIPTQPFPEAHFATFPESLVERCIRAGTSEKGACPVCGAPWVRVVEKARTFESGSGKSGNAPVGKNGPGLQGGGETKDIRRGPCVSSTTTGWRPSCKHPRKGEPVRCVVLDPFMGSGTTALVALKMGRRAIGIELNGEYVKIAQARLERDVPLLMTAGHQDTKSTKDGG